MTTYGPAPAKVYLTKPRSPCGPTVFTKARIKFKLRYDGKTHKKSFTTPIDNCLN